MPERVPGGDVEQEPSDERRERRRDTCRDGESGWRPNRPPDDVRGARTTAVAKASLWRGPRSSRCAFRGPRHRHRYPRCVPETRDEMAERRNRGRSCYPPPAPPAACSRCLRPLELAKRRWSTCYPCGLQHPNTLSRISAVTYGAAGTRPWDFFTTTKFEQAPPDRLATFVNGIAATLSDHAETIGHSRGLATVPRDRSPARLPRVPRQITHEPARS